MASLSTTSDRRCSVALREWLTSGGCIEDDEDLRDQLLSIEYHYSKKQAIRLISKDDMRSLGHASPDWGDSLALTFAYPVSKQARHRGAVGIVAARDPLRPNVLAEFEPKEGGRKPWSQFGDKPWEQH